MLAGGTLALLACAGAQVHYLCATRGEGGETGEPPLCAQEALGTLRERELACAVRALGGSSLDFLNYVDPLVGPGETLYPFEADPETLAGEVQAYLHKYGADALITHGSNGEYGHPAHRLVYQAARRVAAANAPLLLYTVYAAFEGHPKPRLVNPQDPADLVIDVSPALEAKTQAALCHASQNALFVRRASKDAGRPLSVPEVMVKVESLHRASPPVNATVKDELARLLRSTGSVLAEKGRAR